MQRGLTIDQVANDTRISSRFLEALEDEAFEELPAPVYVRGFLRSYANYLHIDAQPLLDQLNAGPGAPAGGPDAFVGGPVPPQPTGRKAAPPRRPAATNPFQRSAPAPRSAPSRSSVPPPAAFEEDELYSDDAPAGTGWSPESDPQPIDDLAPSRRGVYGGAAPAASASGYDEDAGARFRQRTVSGILLERDDAGAQSNTPSRILVIAAGALLALLVAVAAVVALTRGGGNNGAGAPASSGTPGRTPGTVIVVGASPPTPATSASPAAATSASPAATPGTTTPATSPTAASATTPPPTPHISATPLPTATPSPTAVPATPTATRVPATATPIPPTVQPHPQGFAECVANNGDCTSSDGLIHVVCAPNGWFVDIATVPGQHSWPWTVHTVSPPNSNAQTACP